MHQGYIKLHRCLRQSSFYQDSQYVHLWVHLLMSVNRSEKRLKIGKTNTFIDLLPGQVLTSRDKLVLQTGINRSKVERILKSFESEQQIEQQTFSKYRVISISKWQDYQCSEQENEQQMSNKRAASEQQVSTNKKEEKEKKESICASFDAPQDAASYFYLTAKKRKLTGERLSTFNEFMDAFGDRRGKAQAADAWYDIKPFTRALFDHIMAGARRYCSTRQRIIDGGGTPKMAQGWLTAKRWEDEPTTGTTTQPSINRSDVTERERIAIRQARERIANGLD